MQSDYGGVPEIPQFMVESCGGPSLFSISSPNSAGLAASPADIKYQHLPRSHPHPYSHHHHPQPQQPPPPQPPLHFSDFHSIPIAQQLTIHQAPHNQFHQLFRNHLPQPPLQLELRRMVLPHQLALDHESGPGTPASPTQMMGGTGDGGVGAGGGGGGGGGASFMDTTMNFKLAGNESGGGGSREAVNDDGGILQGDEGSESRLNHWQIGVDECAIKEPSWRPLDIDYLHRSNKRCKDKEPEVSTSNYCKKSKEIVELEDGGHVAGGSNYKSFSELEAIYKPGGSAFCGGGRLNQSASGSALTADEAPVVHATATLAAGLPVIGLPVIGGEEASAGEEVPVKKFSMSRARRGTWKRQQQQLSSAAAFFENFVKQLMDHQENLHWKFLDVMERRENERTSREEAWRKQEAAKSCREAAALAQERALTASREDAIIAFLEKITGDSLNLPLEPSFQFPDVDPSKDDNNIDHGINNLQIIEQLPSSDGFNNVDDVDGDIKVVLNSSRWPKAEVQALISVRSGLESRFQEPRLKGPLWEEVSSNMAAMGYCRSAKRCKEKWENINKYFRKTKDSGKKRPQHSKPCPYFQQLDQLYSKSTFHNKLTPPSKSSSPNADVAGANASGISKDDRRSDNCDLLDAIVESTDHGSFKLSDASSARFDFNGKCRNDHNEASGNRTSSVEGPPDQILDNAQHKNKDDKDVIGEDAKKGDEEEESQDHESLHGQPYQLQQDKEEEDFLNPLSSSNACNTETFMNFSIFNL